MGLVILHVPDCPNAAVLESRLAPILASRPDLHITRTVITTEEQARRQGMAGSPTLLLDGSDPFARPGQQLSLSCRLYLSDDGRPGPAPTAQQLLTALNSTAPRQRRTDMNPLIDSAEYAALSSCIYLNQASLGLIPRASLEASTRFLTEVAQHGNLHLTDQAEAEILSTLRTAAAGLLGAPPASVAVVGGASEGLGQLAGLLSDPGGEVILVPSDFPSVTYPWLAAHQRFGMRIRWVPDDPARDLTLALAEAITERTTVVCVSAVQFATGTQVDVAALVARARSAGARVVVDVTQMAGAAPVTMSEWGADALVCSGYKWLSAPGGVALLAVTEDLAAFIPPLVGWMGKSAPFDFTPQELSLAPDARRFQLSTISYSAAAGLTASIKLLTGIGLTSIRDHASRLAADLVEQAAPLGWTPYRPLADRSASRHIVSLRHPTASAEEVQAKLATEHGIITSSRGGGIRVSLHAYNSTDDVRTLSQALASTDPSRKS
jgi:cysteine desulfurase / selenocysteine lyase